MLFANLKIPIALGALPAMALCQSTATSTTSTTAAISVPTPTYLFTATIYFGDVLDPIPLLEGGSVIVEPFVNGTVVGPSLNATIYGGHAAATVVSNNAITGNGTTIQIPSIYVYGETNDGLPFYIQESGVGLMEGQNTRLVIAIGGKYSSLQTSFILAQPTPNADQTMVTVPCFSVPLPPNV